MKLVMKIKTSTSSKILWCRCNHSSVVSTDKELYRIRKQISELISPYGRYEYFTFFLLDDDVNYKPNVKLPYPHLYNSSKLGFYTVNSDELVKLDEVLSTLDYSFKKQAEYMRYKILTRSKEVKTVKTKGTRLVLRCCYNDANVILQFNMNNERVCFDTDTKTTSKRLKELHTHDKLQFLYKPLTTFNNPPPYASIRVWLVDEPINVMEYLEKESDELYYEISPELNSLADKVKFAREYFKTLDKMLSE